MLLKGDQLAAHLERELLPVYLVHGDDPLLVIEAADAIRLAARQRGYDERELLAVTANFNWNDLYHAAANLSLFGGRKVLDLRLPTGKPGRDGSAALQRYCSRCSPDCLLLVSTSQLDWKEEKAAWVGALANAGAMIKLFAPKLGELPAWIAGRLRRQRQSDEAEGLRFIAERVEGNLLAAHQEILKLGVLYPPGTLHIEQIRAAVLNVARYDIDGLREALLVGDVSRMIRTLDGLQQEGEAPPLVLWAMCEEARLLAQLNDGLARKQSLETLFKEARVWGARQALVKRALPRVDGLRAKAALIDAARIDRMIKGLADGDVWNEFRRLGLRIAGV